ncbi:MAG: hypothetical protein RJA58_1236, partial [Pseudomonadota bacterium]
DQFPKTLRMGDQTYRLAYHFAPGDPRDGVTLTVPLEQLAILDPVGLDWLVPGMRAEKVQALLKSLPQRLRRHCVPLPDYAQGFCDRWALRAGSLPLIQALIQDISEQTGISTRRDDYKLESVSQHCWVNLQVIDGFGRRLAEGRDLEALMSALGVEAPSDTEVTGASREVWRERFAQALKEPFRALEKELQGRREIGLQYAAIGAYEQLVNHLRDAVIDRIFLADSLPEDDAVFSGRLAAGRSRVMLIGQELIRWLGVVLSEHSANTKKLATIKAHAAASRDIQQQLSRLLPKDFLLTTPASRAGHIPRYLKAISVRIDKCRQDPARDQRWMADCLSIEGPFWRWADAQRGQRSERAEEFRWMCEELRVSLFAQELKTPMPVSVKRLQKSWANLME